MTDASRILVIKLGALGDFVQAMGPAAAIRAHHPGARITLLTTKPFEALARKAPYFDEVWIDERPSSLDIPGWLRLRRQLRSGRFDRVYDLQTSDRSSFYFRLMGPGARPEWSGIVKGASHPHANPQRNFMHSIERQRDQLGFAGIAEVPLPEISWAAEPVERFDLPRRILLLVPGGAPHRPKKRWPAEHFAKLARYAAVRGVTPVILGGKAEIPLGAAIASLCPAARDLTGQTGFGELAGLAGMALYAVGNDTGPMHVLVAADAPATVLYSAESDPALTAPRGLAVIILRKPDLADLPVEEVAATLTF